MSRGRNCRGPTVTRNGLRSYSTQDLEYGVVRGGRWGVAAYVLLSGERLTVSRQTKHVRMACFVSWTLRRELGRYAINVPDTTRVHNCSRS